MEVVLDKVENFSQFWVYLVQEILVVLITTSLLALFAYIFRKRIKRFLNKKDLFPADKVPNLRLEFEDTSYRTDYQKKMYTLQIENIGAGSVSDKKQKIIQEKESLLTLSWKIKLNTMDFFSNFLMKAEYYFVQKSTCKIFILKN